MPQFIMAFSPKILLVNMFLILFSPTFKCSYSLSLITSPFSNSNWNFWIEPRNVLVDNPVAVRTDDDVCGFVVLRTGEVINRRACRHQNGHPVIEQRPVHRLLQYESIIVIHRFFLFLNTYTSFYLLLTSSSYLRLVS